MAEPLDRPDALDEVDRQPPDGAAPRPQAAALPFRMTERGLEIHLVTSRRTGRWIIPKGSLEAGMEPSEAARKEAYEEAGLLGTLLKTPLGRFAHDKTAPSGEGIPLDIAVFALRVDVELATWPEQNLRRSQWLPAAEAAAIVADPGLASLIRDFAARMGTKPAEVRP